VATTLGVRSQEPLLQKLRPCSAHLTSVSITVFLANFEVLLSSLVQFIRQCSRCTVLIQEVVLLQQFEDLMRAKTHNCELFAIPLGIPKKCISLLEN
jgi:hypothetical protein